MKGAVSRAADLEKGQIALADLEKEYRKRLQHEVLPATQEKRIDFISPFSGLAVSQGSNKQIVLSLKTKLVIVKEAVELLLFRKGLSPQLTVENIVPSRLYVAD